MKHLKIYQAVVLLAAIAMATTANAQQPGPDERWGNWWYGLFGGANINMVGGDGLVALDGVQRLNSGSGLGLALGGLLEYNPGSLLGFNLGIGYDNRAVDFDQATGAVRLLPDTTLRPFTETQNLSPSYISIEPSLRVNLGNRFFHAIVGPSFGINVAKGSEQTRTFSNPDSTASLTQEIANIRSFLIGAQLGLGYDIPLQGPGPGTQIVLTPFAQFRLGFQNFIDAADSVLTDFKENTVRVGIALKFSSVPPVPIDELKPGEADFVVNAPSVIPGTRRINETFPMRNYVFFDAGSTDVPARYKRLPSSEAGNFREEQLIKPGIETGGNDPLVTRSRRQMEVYYNVLNVYGDRLRRNPASTVKLVGSANGDANAGKQMAENVKNYLTSTFSIDPARITTEGRAMPTARSGSGSTQGEDKTLVDAENYRVELVGSPDDMNKPVFINAVEKDPAQEVILRVASTGDIALWTAEITDRNGNTKKYQGTGDQIRIDPKELLGGATEGRYTAKVTISTKNGETLTPQPKEFRLVVDPDEEEVATRYSILFEFDQSKTMETYKDFLVSTVAPAVPDGATVIIHGHTDITGTPEYNDKLSQGRAETAQKILTEELQRQGKTVTFDTYGFGEDERRAPFNNNLAEQRFYNRTVVIEIVPRR